MRKNLLVILMIIVFTPLFIFCDKPNEFDYGHVSDGKYINNYFAFNITLPLNWKVQSKEIIDTLMDKAKNILSGDNKKLKVILDASKINSATLLSCNKYEYGAAVDFNPNILIIVENIKSFPGIKSGSDYLFHTKKY